jgi:hypothetical protein
VAFAQFGAVEPRDGRGSVGAGKDFRERQLQTPRKLGSGMVDAHHGSG